MEEAILPEHIEKRLTLSFKAVKNDIELLKKQVLIAQEINAVSPSYSELKNEIIASVDKSILQKEQKINIKLNEELKKQNQLLQQILERVKSQEKLHEKQQSERSMEIDELKNLMQQKQKNVVDVEREELSEKLAKISLSVKETKQQLAKMKKQQDVLLNESVDFQDVEQNFMTKKDVMKALKLIVEQYQQLNDKNNLQIYDKMSDLRHDFDEIAVYNNQFQKRMKAVEETIDSGAIISRLKTIAENLVKENEQLKHRMSSFEKDVFSLHHRKHKEVDIDVILNDVALLKQSSMTKKDVQHMLDAFSKKINVMRQELDSFERNLDDVDLQTKQFRV